MPFPPSPPSSQPVPPALGNPSGQPNSGSSTRGPTAAPETLTQRTSCQNMTWPRTGRSRHSQQLAADILPSLGIQEPRKTSFESFAVFVHSFSCLPLCEKKAYIYIYIHIYIYIYIYSEQNKAGAPAARAANAPFGSASGVGATA